MVSPPVLLKKKGKYKVRKEFKRRKKNQLHEELFLPFIMSRVVDIVYEKKGKNKKSHFYHRIS